MKKFITAIFIIFVITGVSLAETKNISSFKMSDDNLKEELNNLNAAAQSPVVPLTARPITSNENYLVKQYYPLLAYSCAWSYIQEQLDKNPNWKIKQVKYNGKNKGNNEHSYTIISSLGWHGFSCHKDKFLDAYIELNKNPQDYQEFSALFSARQQVIKASANYLAYFAGNIQTYNIVGSYYIPLNQCSLTIKYFDIDDFYNKHPELPNTDYKVKDLQSPDCDCACVARDATEKVKYVYMIPGFNLKGSETFLSLWNHTGQLLGFYDFKELFLSENCKILYHDVEDTRGKFMKVSENQFKTLKTFNLNDYIDPSSGVKCNGKIPSKMFDYILMTEKKFLYYE